jgi:hypothetical protein
VDPNLFHLDWERTFEVLSGIVLAAFLIERFLSIFFENRALLPVFAGGGLKELTSFAAAFALCRYTHFDAVSMIFLQSSTGVPGEILTAGVVAGGSKASVKLFRDVLQFRSSAYQDYLEFRKEGHAPSEAAKLAADRRKPAGPTPGAGRP